MDFSILRDKQEQITNAFFSTMRGKSLNQRKTSAYKRKSMNRHASSAVSNYLNSSMMNPNIAMSGLTSIHSEEEESPKHKKSNSQSLA